MRWQQMMRPKVALVAVGALVAGLLTILAVRNPGYHAEVVDLSRSVVWVTNDSQLMVGRVNKQIAELDSAVRVATPFDVFQDDDSVLVFDGSRQEVRELDPVTVTLGSKIALPEKPVIAYGGGVLAVADEATGAMWAGEPDSLTALNPELTPPAVETASGLAVAVSQSGEVFAVAPGSATLWVIPTGDGEDDDTAGDVASGDAASTTVPASLSQSGGGDPVGTGIDLPGGPLGDHVSGEASPVAVTAVGDVPVVLDRAAGQLRLLDQVVDIPDGETAVLQQPGPAAPSVLVATAQELLRVSLTDGHVTTLADHLSGSPAAPVLLDGCIHAAWGSVGEDQAVASYVQACGDTGVAERSVPHYAGGGHLVFRVHAHTIVLNDTVSGDVWLADDDVTLINNWDDVQPLSDDTDDSQANAGTEGLSADLTASRTNCVAEERVDPPTPADDEYGVRAGRSTVLHVLDNDAPTDCSMVAIVDVSGWENNDGLDADIVADGQAVQVDVPDDASGALPTLTYHVSDGLGNTAAAQVTVVVAPEGQSEPPKKVHDSAVVTEVLATVSYNVLPNFVSPNGDDLFLSSATLDAADLGDEVTFRPDGTITFADKGVSGARKKNVNFVVSDSNGHTTDGKLTIDVRPDGTAEPNATPVYARTVAGQPLVVDVLSRLTAPSREPLRLPKVAPLHEGDSRAAAMLGSVDPAAGTVTVTGDKAGTYYFGYQVTSGSKSAEGLLRVDVVDQATQAQPPVPVMDVVFLPTGGVVTLDPSANDTDPMATGLAVIDLEPDAAISATLEDLQIVTISAVAVLDSAVSIPYTVSNGAGTARGEIRVVPVPPTAQVAPIAGDITARVRAGDATTIPIEGHAYDINGEPITLTSLDTGTVPANSGLLFHTDSAIRFLAPTTAPSRPLSFGYTVTNTSGRSQTGTVTIAVDDADPATENRPPRAPVPTVARVFTGQSVSIHLPLQGIDPDGDWVTIQGLSPTEPPTLGTAASAGLDRISYTAGGKPGADTFAYTAADPSGEKVTGQVSVLVVAPPVVTRAPVAPDVAVAVSPSRTVDVDVVSQAAAVNSGQVLSLADPGFAAPDNWVVDAHHRDSGPAVLRVEAPAVETVGTIKYTVENQADMTGSGIATVTVTDAKPDKPPTAQDITVDRAELAPGQKTVDVTVPDRLLSNPGGTTDELTVAVPDQLGGQAKVTGDRTVSVQLTDRRQVLAYQVTNSFEMTGIALIVVPREVPEKPVEEDLPALKVAVFGPKITVDAGQSVTIDIGEHLKAADGADLLVPNGSVITVSDGRAGRVDDDHVKYTAAENGDGAVYVHIPVSDGERDPVSASVKVEVIPKEIPAPVVKNVSLNVEVGQDVTQDLAVLATAGNAEQQKQLTFNVEGGGTDFSMRQQGSAGATLVIAATLDSKGSTATYTLTVTDGQGKSGTGTISVTAIASTEPLLQVGTLTVDDGRPGQVSTVDVLGAVTYNPFDTAPTIVDAYVSSDNGSVQVQGGALAITPSEVGTVVASFTLQDATGDPDRQVSGTVTVTVKDQPDRPGTATIVSMESRTVQIKWTAPDDNGSPITSYIASDEEQSFSQTCSDSPCTLTDLTNGIAYRFTVVAVNAIGESEPSIASAEITPDTAPNTPTPPKLTWLDGQQALQLDWSDPGSEGTPVDRYDLEISPADSIGQTRVEDVTGTSYVWSHLTFGQKYTFRIRAKNQSKEPSGWSGYSDGETPSTVADAPTNVSVTFGSDNYNRGGNTLSVAWNAPAYNGGAPIEKYRVHYASSGGSGDISAEASARSATIQGVTDGAKYTVTVVAINRSGEGPASDSATETPFSAPGQVTGLVAEPTGVSKTVALSWSAPDSNGKAISYYKVDWNGGSATESGTSATINGLSNGSDYGFTVTACHSNDTFESARCGSPSQSQTANPYAPVGEPSVSVTRKENSVDFDFSHAPANNGRPSVQVQWATAPGGPWRTGTSKSVPTACGGKSATLYLRAIDDDGRNGRSGPGHISDVVSKSGNTKACTPPSAPSSIKVGKTTRTSVAFSWSNPKDNGHGSYTQWKVGSSGWKKGTSHTVKGLKCGKSTKISVRGYDKLGHASTKTTTKTANAKACPAASMHAYRSKVSYDGSLKFVWIDVSHFPAKTTVTCEATNYDPWSGDHSYKIKTDKNGSGSLHPTSTDDPYWWWYSGLGNDVKMKCSGGGASATQHYTT